MYLVFIYNLLLNDNNKIKMIIVLLLYSKTHTYTMCYMEFLYFLSQEGSRQAESNLKFLLVLKDPCYELSEAKPKDVPAMLPKILNTIRFIWVNSEFYKTRERLTGILKKV